MIVMDYAKNGCLKINLPDIVKDKWVVKLIKLNYIISGLDVIHQRKFIHCDLHHGNILILSFSYSNYILSICDLGLCKPIEYFQTHTQDDIYGILPFVAPEVLRGKPYTPASDIYSFSMIMWEFISGIPPFDDRAHDFQLSFSICKGERPKIVENTPPCYIDLMKKCWDEDPLKRPNAFEIKNIIESWYKNISNRNIINENISNETRDDIIEFYEADKALKQKQINILNTKPHPQAYHTSHSFNFTKQLNEILEAKYSGKFF